jgi:DNA-binding MarR family transcriptional regulator
VLFLEQLKMQQQTYGETFFMPDIHQKTFDLKEFFPYVIARVGSLMELAITPELKKSDMTIDMWRVVMVLHFQGKMSLVDLSRTIGVPPSTLSRLVGRMIEKGWVSRRRSKDDNRLIELRLRRVGEEIFQKYWPVASKIEAESTSLFRNDDLQKLKAMLGEVEKILLRYMKDRD